MLNNINLLKTIKILSIIFTASTSAFCGFVILQKHKEKLRLKKNFETKENSKLSANNRKILILSKRKEIYFYKDEQNKFLGEMNFLMNKLSEEERKIYEIKKVIVEKTQIWKELMSREEFKKDKLIYQALLEYEKNPVFNEKEQLRISNDFKNMNIDFKQIEIQRRTFEEQYYYFENAVSVGSLNKELANELIKSFLSESEGLEKLKYKNSKCNIKDVDTKEKVKKYFKCKKNEINETKINLYSTFIKEYVFKNGKITSKWFLGKYEILIKSWIDLVNEKKEKIKQNKKIIEIHSLISQKKEEVVFKEKEISMKEEELKNFIKND